MQWSEIVAKGQKMKVPSMVTRRGEKPTDVPSIIYEREELASLMKMHRAEAMLEVALHNNCVLFEFPTMAFPNKTDVYQELITQIGRMLGGRLITAPPHRANGKFMVETKFATEEHMEQAINQGITVDDVQYRAVYTRSDRGDLPKMVHVHVSGVPFEEEDILVDKLTESLQYYGKVCQLKMYRQSGVFEGKIAVLLDLNATAENAPEPLQRMLYLSAWDMFAPTSYKGAPQVCYHCHQSGHTKATCTILAAIKCFNCNGHGHIARQCKEVDAPVETPVKRTHQEQRYNEEAVSNAEKKEENTKENEDKKGKKEYLKKQKTEEKMSKKETKTATGNEVSDTSNAPVSSTKLQTNDTDISMNDTPPPEDSDSDMNSEDDKGEGLEASQHAPNSRHMKIDSRTDMLNATRTKASTRRQSQIPITSPNLSGFVPGLGRRASKTSLSPLSTSLSNRQ